MPGQRFQDQPVTGPDTPTDDWQAPTSQARPVAVQRYRSHAPLVGILVGVLVVALVVVAVWASNRLPNGSAPTPGATPTSGPPLPSCPTPSSSWQAIPYEANASTTGCWAVSDGQWDGDTVTLHTTVTSDQGSLDIVFFALDNAQSSNQYDPIDGTMVTAHVASGQSATGTLVFSMPRGDFTLYMAKTPPVMPDLPVAALVIKG